MRERKRIAFNLRDSIEDEFDAIAHATITDVSPGTWRDITFAISLNAELATYTHYGNEKQGYAISTNLQSFARQLYSHIEYHSTVRDIEVLDTPDTVRGTDGEVYDENIYEIRIRLKA